MTGCYMSTNALGLRVSGELAAPAGRCSGSALEEAVAPPTALLNSLCCAAARPQRPRTASRRRLRDILNPGEYRRRGTGGTKCGEGRKTGSEKKSSMSAEGARPLRALGTARKLGPVST